MTSKWGASIYGFAELDMINDSTQSFNDLAGNAAIARPHTYAGELGRATMGVRNSRLGFKVSGAVQDDMRITGQVEVDFFGAQAATPEAAFWTNSLVRMRHYFLKFENPYIDVLAGQTWQLFGWQTYFHPNTVEIQGLPGQVFSRGPQLRLSHTFKSEDVTVDVAVAATRPGQRNSDFLDGQAGLKLAINNWKGLRTGGSTGTAIDSAAIGVSAVGRRFGVAEFAATPTRRERENGWGVSFDGLIPIVPATDKDRANAVTATGSFVTGAGVADYYTGLTGGVTFPSLPNPGMATPAPTYAPDIDNGLVTYDANGELHAIKWQTMIFGLQYYLPPSGKIWLAANYSHTHSPNAADYDTSAGNLARTFTNAWWADGNIFADVFPGFRVGLEYAHFEQKYADGTKAHNERVQLSTFFIF
ncbi:MAG TPA: hypothetical protein VG963_12085 [Polyangiaceae bacterium]|nr:hypothetical protein [Polyangiaceae bacterium]